MTLSRCIYSFSVFGLTECFFHCRWYALCLCCYLLIYILANTRRFPNKIWNTKVEKIRLFFSVIISEDDGILVLKPQLMVIKNRFSSFSSFSSLFAFFIALQCDACCEKERNHWKPNMYYWSTQCNAIVWMALYYAITSDWRFLPVERRKLTKKKCLSSVSYSRL